MELLISAKADLNLQDDFGKTAVRLAVGAPEKGPSKYNEGHAACVKALIGARCDLSVVCDYGWTALHKAAEMGRMELAELLIKGGVEVGAEEKGGETALDKAKGNEHADVVALLEKADA